MRAALHDETGVVLNVIELPDDWTVETDDPSAWRPDPGVTVTVLDPQSPVGPGWVINPSADDGWAPPAPPPPSPLEALTQQVADQQAQIDQLTDLALAGM